jgi:hypothetical protein
VPVLDDRQMVRLAELIGLSGGWRVATACRWEHRDCEAGFRF